MSREAAFITLYRVLAVPYDGDQAEQLQAETAMFPEPVLARALAHLGRTAAFFPKLSEILDACRLELRKSDNDPRTHRRCAMCDDTGWLPHRCPGGGARICGRPEIGKWEDGTHWAPCRVAHRFVVRCGHLP